MERKVFVLLLAFCALSLAQAHGLILHAPDTAEMTTVENGVQVWNYRSDYVYEDLPEPLRGVPGVRFLGNTNASELETDFTEIELLTTSDVYVLWWTDYSYPDWLTETFSETDWQCLMGGYVFNILEARLEAGRHFLGMTGDPSWRDWYSLAAVPVVDEEEESLSVELLQTRPMPKVGDDLTLIAEVWNPTGTVAFAWYFNDLLLEEENGSMLTIPSITSENSGIYRVEVSDDIDMAQDTIQVVVYEALPLATSLGITLLVLLMGLAMVLEVAKRKTSV